MLNLVFLLDITRSMGRELDGVKATVARLVETVSRDHTTGNKKLMVTIITFTESNMGCYVSRDSFANGAGASQFMNKIQLCVPPGMPNVHASGGDGPENHKAALAEMLRLDGDTPTIAFLITDAIPHLLGTTSTEATLENYYLIDEHGLRDSDLFAILDKLHDHFDGNLVLSVIRFSKSGGHALYGAMAKRFNGVLILPQQRTSEHLASGLMAILLRVFRSIAGGAAANAHETTAVDDEALQAFRFYDLKNIEIPESEQGHHAIVPPLIGSRDELLFKFVQHTTVIAGGKARKRMMTAHLVSEQVELVLVLAKGLLRLIPKDEALERASFLLAKVKTLIGDEHASQFKLSVDQLDTLLSNEVSACSSTASQMEAAVSAITLMSMEDTARRVTLNSELTGEDGEVLEPRDPYSSLLAVASLFLGHFAVLELPKRFGVVDSMDAWSATIKKVSNDVVTAADFLQMIGDKESVSGPMMRDREYNFLQLVADPSDPLGSELLRVASGTQVLDILTALLSGAPAGLFSPNMFRGTISACLMTLLSIHSAELSAYQWEIAHKMVHTMRLIMGATPTTLTLEPESAMGELLFRLVRLTANKSASEIDEQAVRGFLEEMAAARAMKFAESDERSYVRLVEEMVGYTKGTNDLTSIDVFAPHVLLDEGDVLAFDAAHAVEVVANSEFCLAFECWISNILRAVFCPQTPPSLAQIWPAYTHDLAKLLLLQNRTERYTLVQSDKRWVRNDAVMAACLSADGSGAGAVFGKKAMALLRIKHDRVLREIRKQRQDKRAQERWLKIVVFMRSPLSHFLPHLSMVVESSGRREHMLLLRAFTLYGHELKQNEYEAKVTAVITGRTLKTGRIVFNRGNLHPHPDHFVPLTSEFKAKLRELQRTHKWSTAHQYRASGLHNRHGFSYDVPSAWAVNRACGTPTFWDDDK